MAIRPGIRRYLLAALGLVFALVASEMGLRAADPMGTRLEDQMRIFQAALRQDAVVGYRIAPHTRLDMRGWTLSASSDGLRGPEIAPRKPGTRRILLLGDSVAMGWGVVWSDSVGPQLAAHLSARLGAPVEVVVAAVSSWNTVAQMRELYTRLPRFDPDAVLLLYINNDAEVKPEIATEHSGEPLPASPARQGLARLAWVRTLDALVQSRRALASTGASPFAPEQPGARDSVAALGALAELCRAFAIPFAVASYGSDPAMQSLLLGASSRHAFPWWDFAASFGPEYLLSVRISPMDSHFDHRGHDRLAALLSARLESGWLPPPADAPRIRYRVEPLERRVSAACTPCFALARHQNREALRLECGRDCTVAPDRIEPGAWQPIRLDRRASPSAPGSGQPPDDRGAELLGRGADTGSTALRPELTVGIAALAR